MKRVIRYSGGLGSFWAAHRIIQKHGPADVTLLFADVKMEDEDLYRFLRETEQFLGVQITRLCEGRDPWEVFRDERFIGSSRMDACSRILKREMLDRWMKENTTPENSVHYVGIDWTEEHRMIGRKNKPGLIKRFHPFQVSAPMMEAPFWDKCRMQKECEAVGIQVPRLYKMGFPHNNCGGFCVKAGHAHFALLLDQMPERYAFHEAKEESMRQLVGDYSILKDRRGGTTKTFTLRMLREMIQAGIREYDTEDWGGCGCSVELSELSEVL